MMNPNDKTYVYPAHYTKAVRTLLRFAVIMLVFGLLTGIAFQESAKRFTPSSAPGGLTRWDASLDLALVHGHVFVTGVLMPVAMAAMLHLARRHGGREVGPKALAVAVWAYIPFVSIAIALMLCKGYHVLLAARRGVTDMTEIDATFMGGIKALRHAIYGLSHTGMAIGLCVFAWCIWRSLKSKPA